VTPDLVGLSDVAALLRVTRQNARKLVVDCEALAPPPVHEGRPTLWRLAKLLDWLRSEKGYAVSEELIELAEVAMQINLAIGSRDADAAAQREILALLA
jgi:hypothetical protein